MKAANKLVSFKAYLVIAIIGSLVLTILSKQYPYFFFDLWITREIQLINNPLIDSLLNFVTWLGNPQQAILSLVIIPAAIFVYGYRKEGLMLLLSALGVLAISETIKLLVLRPRPDATIINQVEIFYRNDSFPSGHVLFFMGFYGFLLYLAFVRLKKKSLRNLFIGILTALIILVGLSRIYLGSHWFSDVLGAYLMGSIWLYLMVLISQRLKL